MRINIKNEHGFTFIELMVVLVILGVLATMIVPRIMGRPEEARRVKAKIDIQSLETALKLYQLDNGDYPTTEQGLQALVEAPDVGELARKWREGGYLEKNRVPKDPWNNDYIYLSPVRTATLTCFPTVGTVNRAGKANMPISTTGIWKSRTK